MKKNTIILSISISIILLKGNFLGAEYLFKSPKKLDIIINSGNEYEGKNVIVFRHINKDSEGWGDVIIAQAKNNISITSEYDYREAAKSIGYDSYYTLVTSWRCQNQDYIYPEVPKVEFGCGDSVIEDKYILYYKNNEMIQNPVFYFRASDREYGVVGNGTWVLRTNYSVELNIGETKLSSLTRYNNGIGSANFVINENEWFMVAK